MRFPMMPDATRTFQEKLISFNHAGRSLLRGRIYADDDEGGRLY